MPEELLEDPPVREMLEWMMSTWGMTKSDLARMFQRTQSTIHHWLNTGQVSHRNLMKIRSSYFFLHDARDPHANERKCERCGKWLPQKEFREGQGDLPRMRELANPAVLLGAPRRAAYEEKSQELVQPPKRHLVVASCADGLLAYSAESAIVPPRKHSCERSPLSALPRCFCSPASGIDSRTDHPGQRLGNACSHLSRVPARRRPGRFERSGKGVIPSSALTRSDFESSLALRRERYG